MDSDYMIDPQEVRKKMPVGLGASPRVPAYAWSNWRIDYNSKEEFEELLEIDQQGYKDEWGLTTDQGQEDIANAAKNAGLGDVNANLNAANAAVVAKIVENSEDEVAILDFGAGSGNTTLAIYNALDEEGEEKVTVHLLEPSQEALYGKEGEENKPGAVEKLEEIGLTPGDYKIIEGTAMDELPELDSEIYQVVTANAAAHHHGYMGGEPKIETYGVKGPLHEVHRVLVPGGFYVDSDWRNSLWEHPARVRQFLEELGVDQNYIRDNFNFPDSAFQQPPAETDSTLQVANEEIKAFWEEYDKVKSTEEPQFLLLEGHRPTEKIVKQLENIGFKIESTEMGDVMTQNPLYFDAVSGLNSLVVGKKEDTPQWLGDNWQKGKN